MCAAIAALAFAGAVSGCGPSRPDREAFRPLVVGSLVPTYEALSLRGDSVHLGGVEAPTVLNVWATWCTSCAEEMAALGSLDRKYRGRGVRVVGVSIDDGGDTRVQRFIETHHVEFPVVHDPDHSIEALYNLVGVPTTFLIGRDGRLVWRYTGNIQDVLADAERMLDSTAAAR